MLKCLIMFLIFNNDVSMYDLKKGMNIRLKLDKEDKVEKNYFR